MHTDTVPDVLRPVERTGRKMEASFNSPQGKRVLERGLRPARSVGNRVYFFSPRFRTIMTKGRKTIALVTVLVVMLLTSGQQNVNFRQKLCSGWMKKKFGSCVSAGTSVIWFTSYL